MFLAAILQKRLKFTGVICTAREFLPVIVGAAVFFSFLNCMTRECDGPSFHYHTRMEVRLRMHCRWVLAWSATCPAGLPPFRQELISMV